MIKYTRSHAAFGGQIAVIWTRAFRCLVETTRNGLFPYLETIVSVVSRAEEFAGFKPLARLVHGVVLDQDKFLFRRASMIEFLGGLGNQIGGITAEAAVKTLSHEFPDFGSWQLIDPEPAMFENNGLDRNAFGDAASPNQLLG